MNTALPRAAAAASNDPAGGFGARSESWYAWSAGSFEVTRSGVPRVFHEPERAATENCSGSDRRASKKVPEPCISVTATYAFQYGTEPKPVHVWRFTPARPNAGGISVPA